MIILLGFPKSGTSSFQKLFTNLGYKSYHQDKQSKKIAMLIKNNKLNGIPLLSNFNCKDCITQLDVCSNKNEAYWPQINDYEQIYNENNDSIFILNKRNPLNLLKSFKNWYYRGKSYHERLVTFNPELLNDFSDEAFIYFVNEHYSKIENFFANKPNSKFISYDIENDCIEKLSQYIDLKDIKEFPHENKNNNIS